MKDEAQQARELAIALRILSNDLTSSQAADVRAGVIIAPDYAASLWENLMATVDALAPFVPTTNQRTMFEALTSITEMMIREQRDRRAQWTALYQNTPTPDGDK